MPGPTIKYKPRTGRLVQARGPGSGRTRRRHQASINRAAAAATHTRQFRTAAKAAYRANIRPYARAAARQNLPTATYLANLRRTAHAQRLLTEFQQKNQQDNGIAGDIWHAVTTPIRAPINLTIQAPFQTGVSGAGGAASNAKATAKPGLSPLDAALIFAPETKAAQSLFRAGRAAEEAGQAARGSEAATEAALRRPLRVPHPVRATRQAAQRGATRAVASGVRRWRGRGGQLDVRTGQRIRSLAARKLPDQPQLLNTTFKSLPQERGRLVQAYDRAAGVLSKPAVKVPTYPLRHPLKAGVVAPFALQAPSGDFGKALSGTGTFATVLPKVANTISQAAPAGIGRNLIEDLVDLPAIAVPSTYLVGSGVWDAVTKDDWTKLNAALDQYKATGVLPPLLQGHFQEALDHIAAHPGWAGLELSGAYAAAGRGTGAAIRTGATLSGYDKIARPEPGTIDIGQSRLNPATQLRKDATREGLTPIQREWSANLFTKALQVAHAKWIKTHGRSDKPVGGVVPTSDSIFFKNRLTGPRTGRNPNRQTPRQALAYNVGGPFKFEGARRTPTALLDRFAGKFEGIRRENRVRVVNTRYASEPGRIGKEIRGGPVPRGRPPELGGEPAFHGTTNVGAELAAKKGALHPFDMHEVSQQLEGEFGLPHESLLPAVEQKLADSTRKADPFSYTTGKADFADFFAEMKGHLFADTINLAFQHLKHEKNPKGLTPEMAQALKDGDQNAFRLAWFKKHDIKPAIISTKLTEAQIKGSPDYQEYVAAHKDAEQHGGVDENYPYPELIDSNPPKTEGQFADQSALEDAMGGGGGGAEPGWYGEEPTVRPLLSPRDWYQEHALQRGNEVRTLHPPVGTERSGAKENLGVVKPRAHREVVAEVAQNYVAIPHRGFTMEKFKASVDARIKTLKDARKEAGNSWGSQERLNNKTLIDALTEFRNATPREVQAVRDSADIYIRDHALAEDEAVRLGLKHPDEIARAELFPHVTQQMGGYHGPSKTYSDLVEARDAARKAEVQAEKAHRKARGSAKRMKRSDEYKAATAALEEARAAVKSHLQIHPHAKEHVLRDRQGNPLTEGDIRTHMRQMGVDNVGFLTHRPNINRAGTFNMRADSRSNTPNAPRTGAAGHAGIYDSSYDALTAQHVYTQGIVDRARTYDAYIRQFGVGYLKGARTAEKVADKDLGREFGRIKAVTRKRASQLAERMKRRTGIDWVVKEVAPHRASRAELDAAMEAGVNTGADLTHSLGKDLSKGGDPLARLHELGSDENVRHGRFVVVPKAVDDAFKEQLTGPSKLVRAIRPWTSAFKYTVLPTSDKWVLGNLADQAMRSLMGGVRPIHHLLLGRRLEKELEKMDPHEAAKIRQQIEGGGFMASRESQGVYTQSSDLGKALDTVEKWSSIPLGQRHLPGFRNEFRRAGPIPWFKAYANWVFKANSFMERGIQRADIGKVAAREIRLKFGQFHSILGVQSKALEGLAHGLRGTEAQVRFAQQLEDIFGRWNSNSRLAREAITGYAPFYLWARNATRFVALTLPAKHPIKTALIAAAAEMTQSEREKLGFDLFTGDHLPGFLQGGIPLPGGSVLPTAQYSSFGVFSDYPRFIGNVVLPQFAAKDPLLGLSWTGDKLTDAEGKIITDPITLAGIALYTQAEALIPALSIIRRIREGGGASAGASTAFSPKTLTGGGGAVSGVKHVFVPRTYPQSTVDYLRRLQAGQQITVPATGIGGSGGSSSSSSGWYGGSSSSNSGGSSSSSSSKWYGQ